MKLYTELDGHGALRSTNIAHDVPHDVAAAHALCLSMDQLESELLATGLPGITFSAIIRELNNRASMRMREWGFEVE